MKKLLLILLMGVALTTAFGQKAKDNTLSKKEKAGNWKLLFDGTTANGWVNGDGSAVTAAPGAWEVVNGAMTLKKDAKGGDIYTTDEYGDFEFTADFNIETGTNTGIKYLCHKYDKGGNLGCEFQIIDDVNGEDNKLANHLLGSFYDVLPPVEANKKVNPPGQWNTIRIVVKGKNVQHWVNGVKVLEYTRGSDEFMAGIAKSKFSKVEPVFGTVEKGRIQLQDHHGPVAFKNIKIRTI
ncbi:3-keto-disaccharide hydrolase [Mucilaginibacter sp. UYCu711]|uniref:3-keto-disaccharide hydrolase n=1 Tax=Mucilaginibacter sp. UYCu711 TaxID=3156339 RepID=UPI003D1BBC28